MFQLFLFCAVLGGTVFVVQFVLALMGFGAEHLDFAGDIPDDLPDDLPHDLPHDVGDFQGDVLDHGSTWLFGVLSFKTVVAALAFFGLAGVASLQGGLSQPAAMAVAVVAGAIAMYSVHYLMRLLHSLRQEGTLRIERSVGKRGTVYIPIPAGETGAGKIQLKLQGRITEYEAMTPGSTPLPTGTRVVVVGVISPTTLNVEPVEEMIKTADSEA